MTAWEPYSQRTFSLAFGTTCLFWEEEPMTTNKPQTTEPTLTKEYIFGTLEEMIDFPSTHPISTRELRVLKAIRFVLKNRTEENWGPKDMTMGEAMSGRWP